MSVAATLTPDLVQRIAPDDDAVLAARALLTKNSFTDLGLSADGTWLLGVCKGSGKQAYDVSADLADPQAPVCRCSCPSRKLPCKHNLGLLLLYAEASDQFKPREPSADVFASRGQNAAPKKKKAGASAPRKVNQAALTKKVTAQRNGLDLLEKLLVDLVSAGQWSAAPRLEKLDRQAKQLADAYLPAAMYVLRRLVLVGRDQSLSDEERQAVAADLIARLWATVQKGRNYLDNKLAGDESPSEADAVMEDVLGKAWQLTELREKGYVKNGLSLLELAYEHSDDDARQQRVEISHQVDRRPAGSAGLRSVA